MLTPDFAFQLAMTHRASGRLAEAAGLLRQIVAVQPQNFAAWHQLGLVSLQQGQLDEAVKLIQRALTLRPNEAAAHSDLGVALQGAGRTEEAIASFRQALRLQPKAAHFHRNLGDALHTLGRDEEAIASYREALALAPSDPGAHNNLGNVHMRRGQLEEARACYERATQLEPRLIAAQSNLGDVLMKLDRVEEGLRCTERVLALDPNFAEGHLNKGVAYWRMKRLAEAEPCYRRAIALRPDLADAHLNLGLLLLMQDRNEEGWREYEWHWRCPGRQSRRRDFQAQPWDGEPAAGKVILTYGDQGYGDTLQFMRYVPLLVQQTQAAKVIVECQEALVPLLAAQRLEKVEFVARTNPPGPPPSHDFHVPLFNLPMALRSYEPLQTPEPYIVADAGKRAVWRARLADYRKPRVGIAWAGNPAQSEDRRRSMSPETYAPIVEVEGITFVNLQIEPRGPMPAAIAAAKAGVLDLRDAIADFSDSAALFAELDLIVTVDTSVAHLAGALGRPTWTMVNFVPDWRWGAERTDSPWYPSMRVFRQKRAGEWGPVIEEVRAALEAWAAATRATP